MHEPTSWLSVISAAMAALSAATLAIFGLDYYSLLWGLVGAMFALHHAEPMGRSRAVIYVLLSTFAGALIGNALTEYWGLKPRILLISLCLVGGIVAQALAAAIVRAAPRLAKLALKWVEDAGTRWVRGGRK